MATHGNQIRQTFVAGADLSTKKDTFVILTNAGERTVNTPTLGAAADGVLLNDPINGQAAAVAVFGRVKVQAGGNIAAGADVATNAQGRVVAAATGNVVLGKATEAAVNNQYITIDFNANGRTKA